MPLQFCTKLLCRLLLTVLLQHRRTKHPHPFVFRNVEADFEAVKRPHAAIVSCGNIEVDLLSACAPTAPTVQHAIVHMTHGETPCSHGEVTCWCKTVPRRG